MKKADLHRKYAWVLDMCEGTGVNPVECVKIDGVAIHNTLTDLVFDSPPDCYTFMVTILEGKPLFVGDEVYWKRAGNKFDWDKGELCHADYYQKLTRTPPARTITLNGEKLPAPDSKNADKVFSLLIAGSDGHLYYYKNGDDLAKVEAAINKLLSGE